MEERERKEDGHYLVFEVGGYPLAARIRDILGVYFEEARQGQEVMELSAIVGKGGSQSGYYLEVSGKEKNVLVKVDKVEPIKDLQLAVWLDFPKIMRRTGNKMVKGFFFDGSRMISLLDFEELLKKKER